MRLKSFGVVGRGPVKRVEVSDLSDVAVLAGPNGVGKTSINNAILDLAQNPRVDPNLWMVIEATCDAERAAFDGQTIDTRQPLGCRQLAVLLQRNQRRNKFESSFLNFDSDRAIRNVQNFPFSWDITNPLLEDVSWATGFQTLSNRYNDVRHSLFRLVESQRRELADQAINLKASGRENMPLDFPDVLAPFKKSFEQLLAPKKLVEVNVRSEQILFEENGNRRPIEQLSSGEREVVNIVFDFLLRRPSDCVIIFDEPELHLHPELSYKLLLALSDVGSRNQFIFSSHSPEIISASLENTVIFVTPSKSDDSNQAVVVHRDDDTHHALQALGQSIGIISLGKKIVLIEGNEASLDKQTYGAILKGKYPEFVLVPAGSKSSIISFDEIRNNIISKTLWGVDFFLICDRDAIYSMGKRLLNEKKSSKVVELPRYHLENYFLDANVLASSFLSMEEADSWLCDSEQINRKLIELARSVVPYAVALNVNATVREAAGNVSIMPKGEIPTTAEELIDAIGGRLAQEAERVTNSLNQYIVETLVQSEFDRLTKALNSDDSIWKADIPGRTIFNKFASSAKIQPGRLKQMYLKASIGFSDTFADIEAIFQSFRA